MDLSPESVLVEVKRLGGGFRCLRTIQFFDNSVVAADTLLASSLCPIPRSFVANGVLFVLINIYY